MALSAKSLLTMFAAASALLALTVEARLKIMSPESLSGMFNSKSIAAQAAHQSLTCLTNVYFPPTSQTPQFERTTPTLVMYRMVRPSWANCTTPRTSSTHAKSLMKTRPSLRERMTSVPL